MRTYRLLLELNEGQLVFLKLDLARAPDVRLVAEMEEILRRNDRTPIARRSDIAWLLEEALRIEARVINDQIDDDASWHVPAAVPDALRHAIRLQVDAANRMAVSRDAVERDLLDDLHRRRSKFIGSLNPVVVAATDRVGLRPDTYNQLLSEDPTICRNRCQAFGAFPMLFQAKLSQRGNEAIRSAIDDGRPLIDELAACYAVRQSAVRCIRGLRPAALGTLGVGMGNLLRLLDDIPPDWRPSTPDQWERFSGAAALISRISRRPITAPSNRLWLRACAGKGYEVQDLSREEANRSTYELEVLSNALCKALCWSLRGLHPSAKLELAGTKAFGQMLSSIGIFKAANIAVRWGNAYRQTLRDPGGSALPWRGLRWPSLSEVPIALGDVVATPLLGAKELETEGNQMKHCVARHSGDCARGKCQIWSLKSTDGESRSTLQSCVDDVSGGGHDVRIGQHRGRANVEPPAACLAAADQLIAELKGQTAQLAHYACWRQSVAHVRPDERILYSMAQPIITAFELTLPKRWSYPRLIELSRTYANSD